MALVLLLLVIALAIVFGKLILTALLVVAGMCAILVGAATLCFVVVFVIGGIWALVYGIFREIIFFLAKKCGLRQQDGAV